MKITIVVGSRFHSLDLARELSSHGHDIELITFYPKFKIKQFGLILERVRSLSIIEYYIRLFKIIFGRFPKNYPTTKIFSRWASRKISLDSDVYIIWASYGLESILKLKEKNPSAKVILERGSTHILEQERLLGKIQDKKLIDSRIIDREIKEYDLADVISIPGGFTRKSFINEGIPENKLFVNPYGVSLDGFYPKKVKEKSDQLIVGYAGVLSAQKNVKGLIEACSTVFQKNGKIQLKLIGPIDHNTFDSKILQANSFVNYHEAVPQKELISFYHSIDLFVLNSIQDGFGMVLLQAMSCGIPVIATVNTGGLDIIRDGINGRVIPVSDQHALAEAIEGFLKDKNKLDEMGKEALKTVNEGFSWKDYGNRYDTFLNSL